METQNLANHRRFVPMYHGVLFLMLLLTLIGAGVNLYESRDDHQRLYSASLILVLTMAVMDVALFCRVFALKAQDRAIRAEENLRHFVLTGKLLDSRLGALQIVALRFASDGELPQLAREAADKNLAPSDIKKAIKSWRADFYRV
jgi:hypothetical protein